jgi:hypothetical protein
MLLRRRVPGAAMESQGFRVQVLGLGHRVSRYNVHCRRAAQAYQQEAGGAFVHHWLAGLGCSA